MIKMFRIDERLIHGQIVIKWSRHLSVDRILVANDAAASNQMVHKSLMMAAPSNIKTAIKSVDESIKILNDPRSKDLKLLVLVNSPNDALKILENIDRIDAINVGNYGRVAPAKPDNPRKMYTNNIYCDDEEVEAFKELIKLGVRCYYQVTPESNEVELKNIFK